LSASVNVDGRPIAFFWEGGVDNELAPRLCGLGFAGPSGMLMKRSSAALAAPASADAAYIKSHNVLLINSLRRETIVDLNHR